MRETPPKTRTFLPRLETRERLSYAEEVGLNISEVINEALDSKKSVREVIQEMVKAKREALSVPVP
jgi:hypothetical protein